jgi:hypothetical protein
MTFEFQGAGGALIATSATKPSRMSMLGADRDVGDVDNDTHFMAWTRLQE